MKRFALSVFGMIYLAAISQVVWAQSAPLDEEQMKKMEEASHRALKTFATLVTRENYQAMGFAAPADVEKGALGSPIREFFVRLDALREYSGEKPAAELLNGGDEFIVPVLVDGTVRSSITVRRGKEGWQAVSFGAPSFTSLVIRQRQRLMERVRLMAGSIFLVRAPALNVSFLGYNQDGRLLFSPLSTDPRFRPTEGEGISAEKALEALVPAAREHNGLPS